MPEFEKPVAGSFCWVEAELDDTAAGKKFYTELFGWQTSEFPHPTAGAYTMFTQGEKHIAGMMKLPDEAKKMGAPPHWLAYIAVDDVDKAADKAKSLGGNVLVPPMDAGPGRMSVLADPTGAVFAIWRANTAMGTWLYNEPGALCWNELMTSDVDRAGKFYVDLFGWKIESVPMPGMTYTLFKNGEQPTGGMLPQDPSMKDAPSAWVNYFSVESCDATTAKAKQLGAQMLCEPQDVPGVGRFATFSDPQGAVVAILQPAPQS